MKSYLGQTLLALVAANLGAAVSNAEPCGPEPEDNPDSAPWKVRLYGANKDRRASRKKRAKKLGRRR